jgi:hypothetical protein
MDIDVVIVEIPEMEDADERNPWISLEREPDNGRFSGNRALTMVTRSDGPRTRYGWTSTVSRREVMDLAGRSFALDLEERLERKRDIIFSMCPLIGRGVDDLPLERS